MGKLFHTICMMDTLYAAWQQIKKKGSAGGIDGQDIAFFEKNAEQYLTELKKDIETDKYTPEPYYAVNVSKSIGSKEKRQLGLPTIRDKIAQQAVRDIIEPIFEKSFLNVSYGYRPTKGPASAIRRVRHMIASEKKHWVTICDIDKFFDTINHEILFNKVKEKIWEPELLNLLKLWVSIGHVDKDGNWKDKAIGISQGAIVSPLLSNIYLHSFDKFMVDKKYGLVRYSDDFIILNHDETAARQALIDAREYLTSQLLLKLNPNPSVRSLDKGFTYMGFFFVNNTLKIDDAKFQRIKMKIKQICIYHTDKPLHEFIRKMNDEAGGLKNYYSPLAPEYQIKDLEEYMKLQVGVLLQKKRARKQLNTKKRVFFDLNRLKQLRDKPYSESKKYINEILDIAWGIKKAEASYKRENNAGIKQKPEAGVKTTRQGSVNVERKIKSKKKEYYKKRILTGNVVVSMPNCFIGRKKGRIVIRQKRKIIKEVAATKVDHISITAAYGVSLSSDLIQLCAENKIPIDFFNFKGEPTAKLFLNSLPDAKIGIAQIEAFQNGKSYHIALSIVEGKINNQMNLLKYFLKYRKKVDPEFTSICEIAIEKMEKIMDGVSEIERTGEYDLFRNRLMAAEGQAASHYWDVVRNLLEDDVEFIKRERQGATDIVNSALNYGYSMLYPRIWQATIQTGLNPMISYLHKEQDDKPTLTFDLIEEFRQQVVDRTIFSIFTKGTKLSVTQDRLSTSSRKIIINEVLERLKTEIRFRKHRMSYEDIIFHQSKALAHYLTGKKKIYNPFVGRY